MPPDSEGPVGDSTSPTGHATTPEGVTVAAPASPTTVAGIDPCHAVEVLGHRGIDREWRTVRSRGIGGSDASAVAGLSRYRSPIDVWVEKVDQPEPIEDSAAAEWGRLLEPVIRGKFARDHDLTVTLPGTLQSQRWPWMLCNLDGLCFDEDGSPSGLEIKTRGFDRDDEWGDDQVADHAEIQAQHNMAVTGLPGFWVCAFLGGWGGFDMVTRWVPRDDDLIADLVEMEREFWHDHVLNGVMPPADSSEAAKNALARRYPVAEDKRLQVTRATADEVWAARRQAAAAKTYGEDEERTKNQLRALLGKNQEAYIVAGDREVPVATWKQTGSHIDLSRLQANHPEVYGEFLHKVEEFDAASFKTARPDLYAQYRGRVLLVKKEVA